MSSSSRWARPSKRPTIDNNSDDSKDRRLKANDHSIGFGLNDLPGPLEGAVKTLYCSFDELRTYLHIQKSNANMFAILQQYPCPVRCVNELKKSYNNDVDNKIDQLYNAKEEYAKRILIDEIYSRFGSSVKLKEKHKISSGTLDLAIMLEHQGKIISIPQSEL